MKNSKDFARKIALSALAIAISGCATTAQNSAAPSQAKHQAGLDQYRFVDVISIGTGERVRGEVEFVTPGTMWDVKFKGESEKYRLYIFEPDCKGASDCIETYRVQGEIAFKKVAVNCNLLITQVLSENPLDNSARGVCKDQVDRSYSITVFK